MVLIRLRVASIVEVFVATPIVAIGAKLADTLVDLTIACEADLLLASGTAGEPPAHIRNEAGVARVTPQPSSLSSFAS